MKSTSLRFPNSFWWPLHSLLLSVTPYNIRQVGIGNDHRHLHNRVPVNIHPKPLSPSISEIPLMAELISASSKPADNSLVLCHLSRPRGLMYISDALCSLHPQYLQAWLQTVYTPSKHSLDKLILLLHRVLTSVACWRNRETEGCSKTDPKIEF